MKMDRNKGILFPVAITAFALALAGVLNRSAQIIGSSETSSEALQALEFWSASRAYPASDISPDAHMRAHEFVRARMKESAENQTTRWNFIGPTNVFGRMKSIAINPFNPNTIYVGSASGGLWRTYSGGLAGDWQRITTGFPVLGVNAIAIDPIDTNIIYIGTGEVYRYQGSVGGVNLRTTRGSYGMGILKTTNAGKTWTKSLDWSYNQERGIQAVRINPLNRNTIFAATTEGIFRSLDGGKIWNPVLFVWMARDISINPVDTTLILATCGNFASPGAGVYRSSDGGQTFRPVLSLPSFSGIARLAIYQANPYFSIVHLAESTTVTGTIWMTKNFGEYWELINDDRQSDLQGWYSRFLLIHPLDSLKVLRGTQNLQRSSDGGRNFVRIRGTWFDPHDAAHHPYDPAIVYIVDDGGVWRSTDFGLTFQSVSAGLQTTQFYSGFSSSSTDSLLALGQAQDRYGWKYTGSPTWDSSGIDEVGWTAIHPKNDSIMYAVNRDGRLVHKSIDRGTTFIAMSTGIASGIRSWNSPMIICPSDPQVLYFGRSRISKSTNAAVSWTGTNNGNVLDGNPALTMAASWTSADTVYVGTAPRITRPHIFRTTNGGEAWDNITGSLPDRYPLDIAVDPTDGSVVYVVFGGYGSGHIFKSTDTGGSWTDITGDLPDVPTTAVAIDPRDPNFVYVGNDIGVFVSKDAGRTWMRFNTGLPEALIVADLTISPSNNMLRLATHGNGAYERPLLALRDSVPPPPLPPPTVVSEFRLEQNYPNPFNPSTVIRYQLPVTSFVTLNVHNVLGQQVAVLVDEMKQSGRYTVPWNARELPSGVYIARLTAGSSIEIRKLILLK